MILSATALGLSVGTNLEHRVETYESTVMVQYGSHVIDGKENAYLGATPSNMPVFLMKNGHITVVLILYPSACEIL